MRIVGGPENLVRANVLRQHVQAPLDWLKGDPAVPLEQLAGPGLQSGVVQPLVVEMAIHAIQPGCDPAPTGLRKPMRTLGKRSHTPPQMTLTARHIISMVCEMMCLAPRLSKRSTPTVGMPLAPPSWKPIAKSSSCASAQNGS